MRRRFALFLVSTFLSGACVAAETGAAFHGAWLIDRIDGAKPLAARAVTMQIASNGQIAGQGPCNGYGARFHLSDQHVDFTPGMTTRMFCGQEVMRQEQRFLSVFRGGATWRVTGARLSLESDGGVTIHATRPEKSR
jgi:heat shock protein HslJ